MSVAYLFPGQGAQTPGFLQRLPDHAAVRATLLEARQFLGEDLSMLDSAQALASTVAVQLGTLIAGVAAARAKDCRRTPLRVCRWAPSRPRLPAMR
jgi:malonate decarboxylase epsilon subunit